MNYQEIEIDENHMLNNNFNRCFDVILQDEADSKEYLSEDEKENILILRKIGNDFRVTCYTRSNLKKLIKKRSNPPFISKNCIDNEGYYGVYYPINIGGLECFFIEEDILGMVRGTHRIYYVEPKSGNNQINCQGRMNTVYQIKVCGGENCLPQIFNEEEEEEEEEEDEEEDEEDYEEDDDWKNQMNEVRDAINQKDFIKLRDALHNFEVRNDIKNELDLVLENKENDPILAIYIDKGWPKIQDIKIKVDNDYYSFKNDRKRFVTLRNA
jgi:hypothetical protein